MKKLFLLTMFLFLFLLTACSQTPAIHENQQGIISYNLENKQLQTIYTADNTNFSAAKLSPNAEKLLLIKKIETPNHVIDYNILTLADNNTKEYSVEIPNNDSDALLIVVSSEIMTDWLNDKVLFNPIHNFIFDADGTNKKICQLPQGHLVTGYIEDLNKENEQLILVHALKPQSSGEEMAYYASDYNKDGKLTSTKNLNISGNTFMVNGNINHQALLLNYTKLINNQPTLYSSCYDLATEEVYSWQKNTTTIILNPIKPWLAAIPFNPTTQLLGDAAGDIVAVYDFLGEKIQGLKLPENLPKLLFPEWLAWSADGLEAYLLLNDYEKEKSYLLKANTETENQEYMELMLELPYLSAPAGMDRNHNIYLLINPASNHVKNQ